MFKKVELTDEEREILSDYIDPDFIEVDENKDGSTDIILHYTEDTKPRAKIMHRVPELQDTSLIDTILLALETYGKKVSEKNKYYRQNKPKVTR